MQSDYLNRARRLGLQIRRIGLIVATPLAEFLFVVREHGRLDRAALGPSPRGTAGPPVGPACGPSLGPLSRSKSDSFHARRRCLVTADRELTASATSQRINERSAFAAVRCDGSRGKAAGGATPFDRGRSPRKNEPRALLHISRRVMRRRTRSAAGYLAGYVAGYQVGASSVMTASRRSAGVAVAVASAVGRLVHGDETVAPPAALLSARKRAISSRDQSARSALGRRRVPAAGVKGGVADAGGATPCNRGRSPRKSEVRTKRESVCVREPNRDAAVICARFVGDTAGNMIDHRIHTTTLNEGEFIAWRSSSSLQLGREV